jgi:hypothetical protein
MLIIRNEKEREVPNVKNKTGRAARRHSGRDKKICQADHGKIRHCQRFHPRYWPPDETDRPGPLPLLSQP